MLNFLFSAICPKAVLMPMMTYLDPVPAHVICMGCTTRFQIYAQDGGPTSGNAAVTEHKEKIMWKEITINRLV